MGKFVVEAKVSFTMTKEVEAESLEEAEKVAERLTPLDFLEYYAFEKWLWENWNTGRIPIKVYPKESYY